LVTFAAHVTIIVHAYSRGVRGGAQALHEWFRDAMERLPSLRYVESALTVDTEAGRVCMEYTRRCDGDPDMLVAELLEVRAGRIVGSRVYHG
jgi:hypothetical protein